MRAAKGAIVLFAACLSSHCSSKPASITVSPPKVKIYGIERAQRLSARILNKKGEPVADATPNWSSANPEIVEVEAGGRIVAKKEGKTTIKATYQELSGQASVEVLDVSLVEVAPALANIVGPVGTRIPLQATVKNSKNEPVKIDVTWDSADPKIATVSPQGIVTSVKPGTVTILAKLGDLQGAAEINVVLREIERVELRPETALVRVGDSQEFQVVAYGADGKAIEGVAAEFTSSDPLVATVDSSGKASGRSAGTATIKARLAGITAQATLLVN